MRQNEIFADAFNYFVYGGEQVINPESLKELDTREIDVPYGGEKGAKQPVQKTRDVIKSVIAMMDKCTAYLLLAIEGQSNIHYAMPVKNMVYDALQYAKQVEEAVVSHKLSGDYKINLLTPASIEDEDFEKFQSSLKEVLSFIKYARDKDGLKKILDSDESFRHLGREEVDVLSVSDSDRKALWQLLK
ncbi:MAG: hypothetical protein Q4C91_04790 [Eubacteriales bacterium]|nr:hypothetical protein [Eubacteriales bacterium]